LDIWRLPRGKYSAAWQRCKFDASLLAAGGLIRLANVVPAHMQYMYESLQVMERAWLLI